MTQKRPSSRTARVEVAGLALVAAAALSACGLVSTEPAGGETDDVLEIASPTVINSLDPVEDGSWPSQLGYGELLMRANDDGTVEPWLLQDLNKLSDTKWKLELRPGIKFHNGDELDASALADALNHHLKESAAFKAMLPGAKAEADGDLSVELLTRNPVSDIPELLADPYMFPVYDSSAVEDSDDKDDLLSAGIYTGPYIVKKLGNREMSLKKNPSHWGPERRTKSVIIKFIKDEQARVFAVQNGEADIARIPPTEAARTLRGRSDAFFKAADHGTLMTRLVMNLREDLTSDKQVRKAISLGINYSEIASSVVEKGTYDEAQGMYPTMLPFALKNQRTNRGLAERVLDDGGWKKDQTGARKKDGKELEISLLTYPLQPDYAQMAVAIQSQLKPLGIRVTIRQVDDIKAAMQTQDDWNLAIWGEGTVNYSFDPNPRLRIHELSDGEYNYGGINDARLDKLINEVAREGNESIRHETLKRIQQIVIEEEAYEAFVGVKKWNYIVSAAWKDFRPTTNALLVETATRSL